MSRVSELLVFESLIDIAAAVVVSAVDAVVAVSILVVDPTF